MAENRWSSHSKQLPVPRNKKFLKPFIKLKTFFFLFHKDTKLWLTYVCTIICNNKKITHYGVIKPFQQSKFRHLNDGFRQFYL